MKKLRSAIARPRALLAALYMLAAALWLLCGLALLVYDLAAPALRLEITGANLVDIEAGEGYRFTATSHDPQIVYEGLDVRVRRVVLYADFDGPPGEMALYYTRGAGQGFSAGRCVYGFLRDDGGYEYSLPPGKVYSLRIDPGAAPREMVLIGAQLGGTKAVYSYFVPGLSGILLLGFGPPLVCSVALSASGLYKAFRGRAKKGDAR